MLRAASPIVRRASFQHVGARGSWLKVSRTRAFADKPSIKDPTPSVLPGTQSRTATTPTPPPGPVTQAPAATPKPPPSSPTAPASSTSPPPPTSPPGSGTPSSSPTPKKKPRRLRRYLLYLILLSGFSYGAAVWWALKSDNFHDFFTEYVPFGEEAVLYFEEREFQKRFPRALAPSSRSHDYNRVTIPGKAGLSWKVAQSDPEGTNIDQKGPHMSAVDQGKTASPRTSAESSRTAGPPQPAKKESTAAQAAPTQTAPASKGQPQSAKSAAKEESSQPVRPTVQTAPTAPSTSAGPGGARKMPEVNEPSIYIPVSRIDPLNIQNANEPVVQDLVKVLNDIILVINADQSSSKMASSVEKAKAELTKIGQKIMDMKKAAQSAAEVKMKSSEAEFEGAARELVRRLEGEIREQESKWRDEFESERQKISNAYEERLTAEVKKINETIDQQSRNQLIEQAISLKKDFTKEVKQIVETERNGRLAKLSELSSSVEELEKLASAWNAVIDTNLQTQHLQVAVEAVRANIERSGGRPFIKELAALKEIAADDSVISSAIASINPIAYQRGIPTSAQLIDRFRSVADEVRKASLLPENAGVASHAASFLVSKFIFKKQGRAVGDDVESVLTRTETLLEEGNLDEAAREMNGLTGWAKTLSRDWLGELRRVLEVRQALDIISTEARLQSLKVD